MLVLRLGLAASFLSLSARADEAAPGLPLIAPTAEGLEGRFGTSSAQLAVTPSADAAAPGVNVTIQPGTDGYPGVTFKPPAGSAAWDLSAYGHVSARLVNTGEKAIGINLRVDNDGDWTKGPWNAEQIWLKPGASGTVTVIFGYGFGKKPGYPLKPEAVSRVLLFVGKGAGVQSFRIEALEAGGPAGEKPPEPVEPAAPPKPPQIKPPGGAILGGGAAFDAAKQAVAQNGATAEAAPEGVKAAFPPSKPEAKVVLKPEAGTWDLRDAVEVRVKVRNAGPQPATPKVYLGSKSGPTRTVSTAAPLAPGEEAELVIPFAQAKPWLGTPNSGDRSTWSGQPGTGTTFGSDTVSSIVIAGAPSPSAQAFLVTSVKAGVPPPPALPEWLGQRPPAEGEWVKTFDDEFDGTALDESKWDPVGPNYWDKKSHWSRANTIVKDGFVTLRYEKKTGFQNDDPKEKQTDYASGFLHTYGKWVQLYGYFESRMKLPRAPGLWPAIWLMPDRGVGAGPQWKRQDTANGGMEFDFLEHLTRWGPYRYNIAMHWDGYAKDHKQTGSAGIYFQPDKDGFVTAGLLWLPGLAVYYCNGEEVLRWEDPRISSIPADIMFTLPTGGWDNNALDDAQLPADYVIDYVRVWQRKDLAPGGPPETTAPAAAAPAG
ncbi:MAG TPA: glycoside hydrolase family 16 protein [Candidatus Methylacidiphilales bacterium]